MAIYMKNGQLTAIDENGNEYQLNPRTTIPQVDGLTERLSLVYKTSLTIPSGGAASIAFLDAQSAMVYCLGWGGNLSAVFYYGGYSYGGERQHIVTLHNGGQVSCGLNKTQGFTLKNTHPSAELFVCIDSEMHEKPPTITYTEDNADSLYAEHTSPPMKTNVEYRTTERSNGKVVYKKMDSNGRVMYRLDGETEWNSYSKLVDAAPDGFGLGKAVSMASVDNFDACTAPGWYHLNKSQTICGVTATYWFIHVAAYGDGTSISEQNVFCSNSNGPYHIIRKKAGNNSTWGEYEIVNPPMDVGVEYRTTERWQGKPVYKKYVSHTLTGGTAGGSSSGSTTYQINLPNDISGFGELISCVGFVESSTGTTRYPMPYLSTEGTLTAVVGVSSTAITVRTGSTWDNRTWRFIITYTKN